MDAAVPEVSVLVATHNAGAFLRPALASLLDQAGVDLEVVLVDNASTDGSVDAAVAALPDPRLRLVRLSENQLHAGGLIAGLPHCRGGYVAMMDADDLSLPGRLAAQADFLRTHPEVDLLGCLVERMDAAGRPLGAMFSLTRPGDIRAYMPYDVPFALNATMARADFWRRVGWRLHFCWAHDYDFFTRVAEAGTLVCLPQVLYRYRVHAAAVSQHRAGQLLISAGFARLAAARRRRGQAEDVAALREEHDQRQENPLPEPAAYRWFARRFLREDHGLLAVMHARRAGLSAAGCWLLVRACFCAMFEAGPVPALRMTLLGPAHALRVQSTPALRPRGWNLFRSQRGPESRPT
ncbi:MAG: putative glycosyltransferase EpsE [Verrucomicrobiota bacterium]|jgi:glycosyltransferase involved in cell wall biosynthesis